LGDIQTDIMSSLRIFTSTIQIDASINLYDKQLTTYGNLTLSNGNLYVNGVIIQGGGGGGSGGDFSTAITSTTLGLATLGYISSAQLISTIQGLGTAGYISSVQAAPGIVDYSTAITSTTFGLGSLGYISTFSLQSTVRGLGTTGYLSSLINLVSTPLLTSSLISINQSYTTAFSTINLVSCNAYINYLSTAQTSVSSLTLFDVTTPQKFDLYANATYLYFGSNIIGGVRTAQPQFITF
jgi:hypothetical protein